MPSKERYARDKAYYEAYHRSDSYRLKVKPTMLEHLRAQGKCLRCHRDLIDGAFVGNQCAVCVDEKIKSQQIRRSFF